MQNAINALEYNLRNTESGIKDLTEQLHATEKGAHRLRGELNDAQRRRADTQQALDILRAVNGSTKPIDPRKDASLIEGMRAAEAVSADCERVVMRQGVPGDYRGKQGVNFLRDVDEAAQNAGRTAENYAAHKSAERSAACTAYECGPAPGSIFDPYRNA